LKVVVADTSPLIAISVMNLLEILPALFETIYVPTAVVGELLGDLNKSQARSIKNAFGQGYLQEKTVSNSEQLKLMAEILDQGEAEAIFLAKELNSTVLIDERAGRKIAMREGVNCIGSLYCLIKAKQNHFIPDVKTRINALLSHGYFLDQSLIETVLQNCDEKI
jgi:predicted nucleic acid-binding protein